MTPITYLIIHILIDTSHFLEPSKPMLANYEKKSNMFTRNLQLTPLWASVMTLRSDQTLEF